MKSLATDDALRTRKSIRAFTDKPVERELIEAILTLAARAPSSANMQPWKVRVLTGDTLKNFTNSLSEMVKSGEEINREYQYYPSEWREPYLTRRRVVGWQLYRCVGIERGEKEKMQQQQARNFTFFDAPVGLIFTMDQDMPVGNLLDMGMFMQSIMIAARFYGLDTCTEAAFIDYSRQVRDFLKIGEDEKLICGMALGFRDMEALENFFETERAPLRDFVQFL